MNDKKIKKIINKAFKEPRISFDEWAEIHKEDLSNAQKVQEFAPAQETEVMVINDGMLTKKSKGGFIATISSGIIFITAAILLLVMLLPKGAAPSFPIIKEYGANDVDRIIMSSEEYLLTSSIDKIDLTKAKDIESINKIVPKDDATLVLGYAVEKILFGEIIEDVIFAYQFDSFARVYEHYFFENAVEFENLIDEYVFNQQKYSYKIINKPEGIIAYISYKKNNVSYYFIVKAFENLCEINERSVKIFIEHIIA